MREEWNFIAGVSKNETPTPRPPYQCSGDFELRAWEHVVTGNGARKRVNVACDYLEGVKALRVRVDELINEYPMFEFQILDAIEGDLLYSGWDGYNFDPSKFEDYRPCELLYS